MKGTSRCLAVCAIILSAALVSVAFARGGGRGLAAASAPVPK
jgi:hypothetical protein